MQPKIVLLIIVLIIAGLGFYVFNKEPAQIPSMEMDDHVAEESSFDPQYSGDLSDVTGGDASGFVQVEYEDGNYKLVAVFEDLPEPEGTDFYEGWVVRRGENKSVISTGKAEAPDGIYVNMFESTEDLRDHDYYVLTLEPDDGDPAPAEHILDGVISPIN